MTPALIELSRAYAALPGAPAWPYSNLPAGCVRQDGVLALRDDRGIRWIDCAAPDAELYEWLPDLTDPATGGAIHARLPTAERWRAYPSSLVLDAEDDCWWRAQPPDEFFIRCQTEAEAVARVAVALGRAA